MNNCGASEEEESCRKATLGKNEAILTLMNLLLYFSYISQALLSLLLSVTHPLLSLFQNLSSFAFLQQTIVTELFCPGKLTACSVHFKFDHHFPNENQSIPFIQGLKRFPLEYGVGVRGLHHSAAFAHVWHHFGPAEVTPTTAGGSFKGLKREQL